MSLLVRIHYHHGRCVELMEKMENVERILGKPLNVLGMKHHGLIILNL